MASLLVTVLFCRVKNSNCSRSPLTRFAPPGIRLAWSCGSFSPVVSLGRASSRCKLCTWSPKWASGCSYPKCCLMVRRPPGRIIHSLTSHATRRLCLIFRRRLPPGPTGSDSSLLVGTSPATDVQRHSRRTAGDSLLFARIHTHSFCFADVGSPGSAEAYGVQVNCIVSIVLCTIFCPCV
jgi:hypothetical protein